MHHRVVLALALSTLGACAGWHRLEVQPDTTLGQRQQVQIWAGGQARVLHAVRLTQDTVFGVPFQLPPACDSCRVRVSRTQVDSIRIGDQEGPAIVVIALALVSGLVLVHAISRGLRD